MKDSILEIFNAEQFVTCREDVNRENRMAIHLFSVVGLPLSFVNFVAQCVVSGMGTAAFHSLWMAGYFMAMIIFDRYVLPEKFPYSTQLIYVLELPVMALAVMLGTVWDPDHQATTVLMFIIALPAFILDRPQRSLLMMVFWAMAFNFACAAVKTQELVFIDSVHIAEFFVASCGVTMVIVRIRLDSLKNLDGARYSLNHDRQTGCLSRYALERNQESYFGKPIIVIMADLDQFTLYNDFYGHKVGDAISLHFARTLMDSFGADYSYRYGGDEMLCVMTDGSEEAVRAKFAACREQLRQFSYEDVRLSLSCAFGYVTGIAKSAKDFREMIQLADIYTHRAKANGSDGTYGSTFDQEHLREGLVQTNVYGHAHSHEINQLTGLPVMSYFVARADELLSHLANIDREPTMGFFKLKNMRDFNGIYGYAQGDALIKDTAGFLREAFPNRHICSITAGQFGLLCYKGEIEAAMSAMTEALRNYKPGYNVEFKAGFCTYTGREKAISLMDKARIAHKSISGRNDISYCFYTDKLDEEIHFRQYVTNNVDEAIEKGYLQVYYQPIIRSVTGHVCNEEALSRWIDPTYGYLMPFKFIPALEESGLMYKVNLNVVRLVLEDFKRRQVLGVPIVPVSVNLSRRDFEQCDMVAAVTKLVDDSGFPRNLIKIEITESAFIANQELLVKEVERFRSNGFEVWMDDFGSEYSTLNLLQELDFDLIKIDMQFMKNLTPGSKNYIIVDNIIDMARRMGITTLIEGVETNEQYMLMRTLGCEKIQGFLFNKPNSTEYIVNRSLRKTGLTFEEPSAVPYYEAVGRVDLDAPMTLSDFHSEVHLSNTVPAGIVEWRKGRMMTLRGNESFISILEAARVLKPPKPDDSHRQFIDPLPSSLTAAARKCEKSGGWVRFDRNAGGEDTASVFLKRVSSYSYNGGTAMMMVVLRN